MFRHRPTLDQGDPRGHAYREQNGMHERGPGCSGMAGTAPERATEVEFVYQQGRQGPQSRRPPRCKNQDKDVRRKRFAGTDASLSGGRQVRLDER